MLVSLHQHGHSADVKMERLLNGAALPVSQLGPDFLLLKTALEHPPVDDAVLIACIDGREQQWKARLPEGASAGSRRIAISQV